MIKHTEGRRVFRTRIISKLYGRRVKDDESLSIQETQEVLGIDKLMQRIDALELKVQLLEERSLTGGGY